MHYYTSRSAVLHVTTNKDQAQVSVRNIAGDVTIQFAVKNLLQKIPKKPEDNLVLLASLRTLPPAAALEKGQEKPVEVFSSEISPELIISVLPTSLQSRMNEKLLAWEPVRATSELQGLIGELDRSPVHDQRSVGVLYLEPGCKFLCGSSLL